MLTHSSSTSYKIVGIDPGYDRVGWAIGLVEQSKLSIIDFGCITSSKEDNMMGRLTHISQEISSLVNNHRPQYLSIESVFFAKNQKTALAVAQARGVILSPFLQNNMDILEYTPLEIKQAVTGSGRASKQELERAIRMQIKLPNQVIIDDAMDAIGAVVTAHVRLRIDLIRT
jgi:crossover junction endodeoxyribonuclease RuvC